MLCIRRTFAEGRAAGFATGLGAATADAFYGAVAAFGLTAASGFLPGFKNELRLVGGIFLVALGVKTFFDRFSTRAAPMQGTGLAQAYLTTVVLTLTNPTTILSFLAVFAGAGLAEARHGIGDAAAIVAGVFLGSALWWLLLSGFVGKWRERYPEFASLAPSRFGGAVVTGVTLGASNRVLTRVNRVSGLMLAAFGIAAMASLL